MSKPVILFVFTKCYGMGCFSTHLTHVQPFVKRSCFVVCVCFCGFVVSLFLWKLDIYTWKEFAESNYFRAGYVALFFCLNAARHAGYVALLDPLFASWNYSKTLGNFSSSFLQNAWMNTRTFEAFGSEKKWIHLNTNVITSLDMCKICTEACRSVAFDIHFHWQDGFIQATTHVPCH